LKRPLTAALVAGALGAFLLARGAPDPTAVRHVPALVGEGISLAAAVWPLASSPPPQAIAPPRPPGAPPADNGPYASRGLGLSREAWESAHGPPGAANGDRLAYLDGRLLVGFRSGNVVSLELLGGERTPRLLEEARIAGRGWLPQDARFLRTYVPADGPDRLFIDVYASDSLGRRFPDAPWRASPWTRGAPGVLVVAHRLTPDLRVTSTVVSAGDLP
jgi:hypothetical protein